MKIMSLITLLVFLASCVGQNGGSSHHTKKVNTAIGKDGRDIPLEADEEDDDEDVNAYPDCTSELYGLVVYDPESEDMLYCNGQEYVAIDPEEEDEDEYVDDEDSEDEDEYDDEYADDEYDDDDYDDYYDDDDYNDDYYDDEDEYYAGYYDLSIDYVSYFDDYVCVQVYNWGDDVSELPIKLTVDGQSFDGTIDEIWMDDFQEYCADVSSLMAEDSGKGKGKDKKKKKNKNKSEDSLEVEVVVDPDDLYSESDEDDNSVTTSLSLDPEDGGYDDGGYCEDEDV